MYDNFLTLAEFTPNNFDSVEEEEKNKHLIRQINF